MSLLWLTQDEEKRKVEEIEMDKIKISGLKVFAHHGVFEEEKQNGQDFYINAKLYLDLKTSGKSDCLEESVNYGEVCHFITDVFSGKTKEQYPYDLIEAAAQNVCESLLLKYGKLENSWRY